MENVLTQHFDGFALTRRIGIGLLAGAAGGIVAGLGARIAMRIVADTIGQYPALTLEGTLLSY